MADIYQGEMFGAGELAPADAQQPRRRIRARLAIEPVEPRKQARRKDPDTSKATARLGKMRWGSDRATALMYYDNAGVGGLTADQACELVQRDVHQRVSDLRRDGYIEDSGLKRNSKRMQPEIVFRITNLVRLECERLRRLKSTGR